MAANTLGRILTSARRGAAWASGAAELAALHRRRDPSISAGWLKALIYGDSTMSLRRTILSRWTRAAPVTAPPALPCTSPYASGLLTAGAGDATCWDRRLALRLWRAAPTRGSPTPGRGGLDALIAAANNAAAGARGLEQSGSIVVVASGRVRGHVPGLRGGASAQRVAQRCAAMYAARRPARARRAAMGADVQLVGTGKSVEIAEAYRWRTRGRFPGDGEGDGGHVFTAANMVIVAAELVRSCPATSPFEPP